MTPRIGIGYDVHPLVAGRPLVLGGVTIPHDRGLQGHSDADVLLHAVIDALLGAAGLNDIGTYFPNTDPRYKDISSMELLRQVCALLHERGWQVVNIDVSVVSEQPKLKPHFPAMREHIAPVLGVSPEAVGLKATTNEGMGFVGRGEGIAVMSVALIDRRPETGD